MSIDGSDHTSMVSIHIAEEVRDYRVSLYAKAMDVKVRHNHDYSNVMDELKARLTLSKDDLKNHPVVRALRDFYWRLGIDPTKVRPSSEALARRFLMGKMPRINNVVDAGNIASIETLVPIGIYDLAMVKGRLVLRRAISNEEFIDITGKASRLTGKEIVLADEQGVIHVFPHRDALRTSVKDYTSRILVVGCYIMDGMDASLARVAVDRTIELIKASLS
ncbi:MULTISPECIES: B3/4 domain-containing protein [Candidatus Nitrosocaldus]|jgi:DNA/RNA-binding domain of Phe-tRNA-synthetase-like protein|uniref:B3/4 domain protein n=1 Tax=Candidatus Nitrosocaldus cavascurensis TaxID=2058097 RepID=A0A2K5AT93_9ARCH|nr:MULTISPECIES: phenylalanine--tRNA ligase beta subunit-related protein [Candidatus Nitrosocaldus]SPC34863.1 B3/4 domain protein [Candidatus Nitrosocaldus cavascurensis]